MIELQDAIKQTCKANNPEDHYLIFKLQETQWQLDNKLEIVKMELQNQTDLKLKELKNTLDVTLVQNGYETIDETIEVES